MNENELKLQIAKMESVTKIESERQLTKRVILRIAWISYIIVIIFLLKKSNYIEITLIIGCITLGCTTCYYDIIGSNYCCCEDEVDEFEELNDEFDDEIKKV